MPRYLLLTLEAPLMAFGGEVVDAIGVIEEFPSQSMLTGLFGNALGYRREETGRLRRLQERISYGARIDPLPGFGTRGGFPATVQSELVSDFQTVQLGASDLGWTSWGVREKRAGGAQTYDSPHIRRRDYDADKRVVVAVGLAPAEETPHLGDLARALDEPARPLFIGRKSCIPTARISGGMVDAADLAAALANVERPAHGISRLMLPGGEAAEPHDQIRVWTDRRNWISGVHGGAREIRVRSVGSEL